MMECEEIEKKFSEILNYTTLKFNLKPPNQNMCSVLCTLGQVTLRIKDNNLGSSEGAKDYVFISLISQALGGNWFCRGELALVRARLPAHSRAPLQLLG